MYKQGTVRKGFSIFQTIPPRKHIYVIRQCFISLPLRPVFYKNACPTNTKCSVVSPLPFATSCAVEFSDSEQCPNLYDPSALNWMFFALQIPTKNNCWFQDPSRDNHLALFEEGICHMCVHKKYQNSEILLLRRTFAPAAKCRKQVQLQSHHSAKV